MFHTISKISKKANLLPINITNEIRGLPPFNKKFNSLWEEVSSLNVDNTIVSYMDKWGEELAIDLHRLNGGKIEELSGRLWLNWKKARKTVENIRRGIRGSKKDVMRQSTKEDYRGDMGEYHSLLKQHGRLPAEKVGVEYSGGAYSNGELLSYFNDNKERLEIISEEMSFEAFVDNFLVRLSSTPRYTNEHQGNKLGVSVPSVLLEMVQDDIDFETYDLAEATFTSGPSLRQKKRKQRKYDGAVATALGNVGESIKNDLRGSIEKIIEEKESGGVYNNKNLVRTYSLSDFYRELSLNRSEFETLYDDAGGLSLVGGEIESAFVGDDFFDIALVNKEKVKNGIKQIAEGLFAEIKAEKREEAFDQLKRQISSVNAAWGSNNKVGELLDILKENEVTTTDVKKYVGRSNLNQKDLKDFYDEILDRVNVEPHLKTSISIKTKKSRKAPEKAKVSVTYIFKKSGRTKLNNEIDRILESHSAFESVAHRAKHYVKIKIKEEYAKAKGIEADQIEG